MFKFLKMFFLTFFTMASFTILAKDQANINGMKIDMNMLKQVMGKEFNKKKLMKTFDMLQAQGLIDQKTAAQFKDQFKDQFNKLSESDFQKIKKTAIQKIGDGTFEQAVKDAKDAKDAKGAKAKAQQKKPQKKQEKTQAKTKPKIQEIKIKKNNSFNLKNITN